MHLPHYPILFLTAFTALTTLTPTYAQNTSTLAWTPCPLEITSTLPIQCADLTVPLDHTTPTSNKTLTLNLLKVPALKPSPQTRTILMNFGGPGAFGRVELARMAAQMQATSGGHHDLVIHDPRGTASTLPFSCYANASAYAVSQLRNRMPAANASDAALGTLWAGVGLAVKACEGREEAREWGELIGTVASARDLLAVVDALGEDGLLRYWGYSYGTTLGATAVALWPERVERVVLDGCMDVVGYWGGHDVNMYTDTDAVYAGFLSGCIEAGASKCALAAHASPSANATKSSTSESSSANKTTTAAAASLEQAIDALLENIKYAPIPYPERDALVDYTALRNYILLALYLPAAWGELGSVLATLLTYTNTSPCPNNASSPSSATETSYPLAPALNPIFDGPTNLAVTQNPEARYAIKGADTFARNPTFESFLPVLEQLWQKSKVAWDTTQATYFEMLVSLWPFKARERYTGDFRVRTRSKVLVVGVSRDTVTPISAARVVAERTGGVLLEQEGIGHTTLAQASRCTADVVTAYFLDGTLPEEGKKCGVDVPLFSNLTWRDILPMP